MDKLQWTPNIIDCLITHQVGERPFAKLSEMFGVGTHKMTQTYPKLGNITSATLPVNLSLGMEQGQIKQGDCLFVAMSGSGISVSHAGLIL